MSQIVYNCKSDTYSPGPRDDIVLSLTHFPKKPMIFAVVYGCTSAAQSFIANWFQFAIASAFDPLILPMAFAELQRRRLMNTLEPKGGVLYKRIIDMENRLWEDEAGASLQPGEPDLFLEKGSPNQTITQREFEVVKMWVDVSSLKNGFESFKTELNSMLETSKNPLGHELMLGEGKYGDEEKRELEQIHKHSSESIQGRLQAMIVEIDSRVRFISTILGGMTLATQTVCLASSPKYSYPMLSCALMRMTSKPPKPHRNQTIFPASMRRQQSPSP